MLGGTIAVCTYAHVFKEEEKKELGIMHGFMIAPHKRCRKQMNISVVVGRIQ